MKKSLKVLSLIAAVVLGLGLVGCGDANVDFDEDDSGADVESIGTSWGALFTNQDHDPLTIQIWEKTFECDEDKSEGLKVNIALPWFGGVLCQKSDFDATSEDCVFYDMSKVTKMTFKAKASKPMTVSCVYTTGDGKGFNDSTDKPNNVNATTEWKEFTYEAKGAAKAYAIFTFVGEGLAAGDWVMFKDITYYDAAGESVAIKYAK